MAQVIPLPETEGLREKLWNDAYDGLRDIEPKVVKAFENILVKEWLSLSIGIAQNRQERAQQMKEVVDLGLNRTEKEASIKAQLAQGYDIFKGFKGLVEKALQASPEAALAWACTCCSLEILSSSLTQPKINRDGLEYVTKNMEWYWNLSELVFADKVGMSASIQTQLGKSITSLYQKLLLYQMKSACLYRRKRLSVVFRDSLKLDDWQGKLDEIKAAEAAFTKEASQYNDEATIAQLVDTKKEIKESIHDLRAWHDRVRQDDKNKETLRALHITDPRKDKTRIEELKGGLLEGSYRWILDHPDFVQWKDDADSRLLWIKGDPGKGKTMLLCGIIDELKKDDPTTVISYFFCQATEERLSTATNVLRGLLFLLIERLPPLVSYLREEYDTVGSALFTNHNAWTAMSKILESVLSEPSLDDAVIVVDALDECGEQTRPRLIELISHLSVSFPAKWIVSSRNWPEIEREFRTGATDQKVRLRLEMNQDLVTAAICSFIDHRVNMLDLKHKDRVQVVKYLKEKADGTFLWVALVCQALAERPKHHGSVQKRLKQFPAGLDGLYRRMMEYVKNSDDAGICLQILSFASVAYRPLSLDELFVSIDWRCWSVADYENGVVDENNDTEELDIDTLREAIMACGSFLIIRQDVVYFVHQSAQDFLQNPDSAATLLKSVAHRHRINLFTSLNVLGLYLRRDMYDLKDPGTVRDEISTPEPDPLRPIVYHVRFWTRHLLDWEYLKPDDESDKEILGKVYEFFHRKVLYFLEAACLLGEAHIAYDSITTLIKLCEGKEYAQKLFALAHGAMAFVFFFWRGIEQAPLQIYASALLFMPEQNVVRRLFLEAEGPKWVTQYRMGGRVRQRMARPKSLVIQTEQDSKTNLEVWDSTTGTRISANEIRPNVHCLRDHRSNERSVSLLGISKNKKKETPNSKAGSWIRTVDTTGSWHECRLDGKIVSARDVVLGPDGQLAILSGRTVKFWPSDRETNHSQLVKLPRALDTAATFASPDALVVFKDQCNGILGIYTINLDVEKGGHRSCHVMGLREVLHYRVFQAVPGPNNIVLLQDGRGILLWDAVGEVEIGRADLPDWVVEVSQLFPGGADCSHLLTDRGMVSLSLPGDYERGGSCTCKEYAYAFDERNEWVVRGGRKILWLPSADDRFEWGAPISNSLLSYSYREGNCLLFFDEAQLEAEIGPCIPQDSHIVVQAASEPVASPETSSSLSVNLSEDSCSEEPCSEGSWSEESWSEESWSEESWFESGKPRTLRVVEMIGERRGRRGTRVRRVRLAKRRRRRRRGVRVWLAC